MQDQTFNRLRARLLEAMPMASPSDALTDALKAAPVVAVQTHDFPDHDAVASAFGLAVLLRQIGFAPRLFHRGRIRSRSLAALIKEAEIKLETISDGAPPELRDVPLVIVDGNPVNANAAPATGRLVGIVDHHPGEPPSGCAFSDIRPGYGACSSIIVDYWREAGLEPPKPCASALLMGIQVDTDFLSRNVSPEDLAAHGYLFFLADWRFTTHELKASLSVGDMPAVAVSAERARIAGRLFFTVLPLDCSQELISILADFYLRLREIAVTVIVETGGDRYHVSIRSRLPEISAAAVVKRALAGIGSGGGHDHMAGGAINPARCPADDELFKRFEAAVYAEERK